MQNVISGDVLDSYLSDIKLLFRNYNTNKLRKIIFLSVDSFFGFIDQEGAGGRNGMSFRELMDSIEPFIPLVITEENLDAYLMTAMTQDEEELNRLQRGFIQNSKIRFIRNIFGADSEEDLEEVLKICRTIRDYKEKAAAD